MSREDDLRLELRVGRLLGTGVLAAAASLAAGLVVFIVAPAHAAGPALLSAGLIALMATPVLRVLAALVEYLRTGDLPFLAGTVAVLVELAIAAWYASTR